MGCFSDFDNKEDYMYSSYRESRDRNIPEDNNEEEENFKDFEEIGSNYK